MRFVQLGSVCFVLLALSGQAPSENGKLLIRVTEKDHETPVPCRVHLKDREGKPQRAAGLPQWNDHFVIPGSAELELAPGLYSYEIERGPEYAVRRGSVSVEAATPARLHLEIERIVDLAKEGWWSGELHVHRPLEHIELLMRAEDLHVAPVITWWNNQNLWATRSVPAPLLVQFDGDRYHHVMAGEDEREGGALLYFQLPMPLAITGAGREYPSPMKFLAEARESAAWVDIEKPFWWDVPVWLASGQVDSIGLANNHMCRSRMLDNEAWGKARDTRRFPSPRGNGLWTQEIYYHILNCGLRLPPSAGSASGVLPNPVGYNRVYTAMPGDFTYEKWWDSLRAGRSFVTNGPLLRVRVEGELPGHIFSSPDGTKLKLAIEAALDSADPVRSIEVITNGRVERTVSTEELRKTGSLGSVTFERSGWLLVRAIAEVPNTFRFASTAPYYIEIGDLKRRISRSSAQFLLDLVRERMLRVNVDDPMAREAVLVHHRRAESFWVEKVINANAE